MGWKAIEKAYCRGGMIASVDDDGNIMLGFPFTRDCVRVISKTGFAVMIYDNHRAIRNAWLDINADRAKFVSLMAEPDQFDRSIPVYTVEDGKVKEYACETPGFPNRTHCGRVQLENVFFETPEGAITQAIKVAKKNLASREHNISQLRDKIASEEKAIGAEIYAMAKLEALQASRLSQSAPSP